MVLTQEELQSGLDAWYQLRQERAHVGAVSLLGSGYETDVFAFSLQSTREDAGQVRDLVLRLYAGEGADEKAAREFAAMTRLREAGYPVPQVIDLQRSPSPFGRPFVIMERIDGVSLESAYWSASEGDREVYPALHYRLMAQLHALPGSTILPNSPLAGSQDPYGFLNHELSLLSEMLGRLEEHKPPSLLKAWDWLVSRRSSAPCERLAVIHGDFHRNNVLVRADGVPFVIDWSNVRLADYRMDLAWTQLIARIATRRDGGQVELHLYERFAGKPVWMLEYFEAAACLRLLLSVLISLRYGSARQGMRPEAEALMRRDADHTLYVAALLQERTGLNMIDFEKALAALLG